MATIALENGSSGKTVPTEMEKTKTASEKITPSLIPAHQIKKEPGIEDSAADVTKDGYKTVDFDLPAELVIDEVASQAMLRLAQEVKKENGTQFEHVTETQGTGDRMILDGADSDFIVQKTCTKTICKYCAYQFTSQSEIQHHIQMHKKGKAPHACSQCGKEYRTPSKLQRHVRVHSGERPYGCDVCGKRFTRSDHVKQHMKTHQPQKQMNICRICDVKFMRPQSLHQHLQQVHDIEPTFKCHRCGEVFEALENLNSHMQSHDPYHQEMMNGMHKNKEDVGIAKFNLVPKFENHNSGLPLSGHSDCYEPYSKEDTTDSIEEVSQISYQFITEHMMQSYKKQEEEKRNEEIENAKRTETIESEDGMSMFIVPSNITNPESPASSNENDESTESINDGDNELKNDDDDDGDSVKRKVEIKSEINKSSSDIHDVSEIKECPTKREETSLTDSKTTKDSNLCQNSILNTQAVSNTPIMNTFPILSNRKEGLIPCNPSAPMVSLIKSSPKISQLLRDKVNSKYHPYRRPVEVAPMHPQIPVSSQTSILPALVPKSNILYTDSTGKANFMIIKPLQGISVAATPNTLTVNTPKIEMKHVTSSSVSIATPLVVAKPSTTALTAAPAQIPPMKGNHSMGTKKMLRCEHCCICFDDIAMSSLHHTLHLADEADPFTCPKCLKKLGNRLEFMAHLIYHLQPNMDV